MLAPAVMTTLVIGRGPAGWLVLGGVFVLAVLPATPATRWALRTRGPGVVRDRAVPEAAMKAT
jgi:hypothetical protein